MTHICQVAGLTEVFLPATTKSRELGGSSRLNDIVGRPRTLPRIHQRPDYKPGPTGPPGEDPASSGVEKKKKVALRKRGPKEGSFWAAESAY